MPADLADEIERAGHQHNVAIAGGFNRLIDTGGRGFDRPNGRNMPAKNLSGVLGRQTPRGIDGHDEGFVDQAFEPSEKRPGIVARDHPRNHEHPSSWKWSR